MAAAAARSMMWAGVPKRRWSCVRRRGSVPSVESRCRSDCEVAEAHLHGWRQHQQRGGGHREAEGVPQPFRAGGVMDHSNERSGRPEVLFNRRYQADVRPTCRSPVDEHGEQNHTQGWCGVTPGHGAVRAPARAATTARRRRWQGARTPAQPRASTAASSRGHGVRAARGRCREQARSRTTCHRRESPAPTGTPRREWPRRSRCPSPSPRAST